MRGLFMKKFVEILCLLIIATISCAFTFPDNLPDWKKLNSYKANKLKFQKTTLAEFKKSHPNAKVFEYDKNVKIIATTPQKSDVFKNINVGFRDDILDWLEFELNKKITMQEITSIYGLPYTIDTSHSKDFDYYNYEKFNVSTDKKHEIVKSISIFDFGEPSVSNVAPPKEVFALSDRAFFSVFPELKPGQSTEEDFVRKFPVLLPYTEENIDTIATYTLVEELGSAKDLYKKAVLRFENGLLCWISLIPTNPDLNAFLAKVKDTYKIEKANSHNDFYVYKNFILVVDRNKKTINSIGVINFDKRI
jgi:hypothetical protein